MNRNKERDENEMNIQNKITENMKEITINEYDRTIKGNLKKKYICCYLDHDHFSRKKIPLLSFLLCALVFM